MEAEEREAAAMKARASPEYVRELEDRIAELKGVIAKSKVYELDLKSRLEERAGLHQSVGGSQAEGKGIPQSSVG